MADTKIKEKHPTVDHIITLCWFVFEVFADEAGEGIETQLDCGGADTSIGGFASGVGAATGEGEGEREKKKLERDGDGEGDSSGDVGESEGLSDGDGEKGSESGDSVEGKGDGDGERVSLSSSPLSAPFAAWRSFLMCAVSPCWPMCLIFDLVTHASLEVALAPVENLSSLYTSGVK